MTPSHLPLRVKVMLSEMSGAHLGMNDRNRGDSLMTSFQGLVICSTLMMQRRAWKAISFLFVQSKGKLELVWCVVCMVIPMLCHLSMSYIPLGGLGSNCIAENPFHRHHAQTWKSIEAWFYPREVVWLKVRERSVKGQAAWPKVASSMSL